MDDKLNDVPTSFDISDDESKTDTEDSSESEKSIREETNFDKKKVYIKPINEYNTKKKVFDFLRSFFKIILIIILLLVLLTGLAFYNSGSFLPFVSVASDSMSPNINQDDTVYYVDNNNTNVDSYGGVVAKHDATEENFGMKGDVIIFYPNGDTDETPIIHRAIKYVDEGDEWTYNVSSDYLTFENCSYTQNCPAPNEGFITLGDANDNYDQISGISRPVKEEWIIGVGRFTMPTITDAFDD